MTSREAWTNNRGPNLCIHSCMTCYPALVLVPMLQHRFLLVSKEMRSDTNEGKAQISLAELQEELGQGMLPSWAKARPAEER